MVIMTIAVGAFASVFWYGGRQVIDGTMTLGRLQAFILYSISSAPPQFEP